jgi:hypothetical protein
MSVKLECPSNSFSQHLSLPLIQKMCSKGVFGYVGSAYLEEMTLKVLVY